MKLIEKTVKNTSLKVVFSLLFVTVTLVSVLIYTIFFNSYLENQIIDRMYKQNSIITLNTKEYVDEHFQASLNIVLGIEGFFDVTGNPTIEDVENFMGEMNEETNFFNTVEILSSDMITEYVYPHDALAIGIDHSTESELISLIYPHTYHWLEPQISFSNDSLTVSMVYRTEDRYIITTFDLTFFEELHSVFSEVNEQKEMMILNEYGIIIYDSGSDKELYKMRYENFDKLIPFIDKEGTIIIHVNDVESVISIEELSSQNWYITIYETKESSYQFINQLGRNYWYLIMIVIILYIVSAYHFFNIIGNKLKKINKSLQKITTGDYGLQIEGTTYKEIQGIVNEFNKMSLALKESRTQLEDLAYKDKLTGLYSRNYLRKITDEIIASAPEMKLYMFYIDLTRFHIINESYGYEFGDKVLIEVANRLNTSLQPMGTLGRIESDEFVIVCGSQHEPESSSKNIIKIFDETFDFDLKEVKLTPSIGVCNYPDDGSTFDELLSNANIALIKAKSDKVENFAIFNIELLNEFKRKLDIEISIDRAFRDKEFTVEFQPMLNIKDESIRGFEALSRWQHPKLGRINPNEFIETLEELNKIHILDKHTLKESLKQTNRLNRRYDKKFIISINISGKTIIREGFVDMVKENLKKHNFDPTCLELELTETVFIDDYNKIKQVMHELSSIGVKFSEDDFGDGYSSLNYLAELELDTLKISRTILSNLKQNVNNRILVEAIVRLSKELGFETVVEGVEDYEMLQIFKELECTYVQGYYFYRPMGYLELLKELDKKLK